MKFYINTLKFLFPLLPLVLLTCAGIPKLDVTQKLSFSMTGEEIIAYYQLIDILVDKKSTLIDLGVIDYETKENITIERADNSKYFESTIRFKYENMNYVFPGTPVKPDGYINFNNYWYRNIDTSHVPERNFIYYSENIINPLKTYPGFIVTEYDMPIYVGVYEGVGRKFVGMKEAGLIKSGTVLKINHVSNDDYAFVVGHLYLQGSIKLTDIDFIVRLRESVLYKIIDNKLYRFIEGQKIEIEYWNNGYTEEGLKYIRNEANNLSLRSFYFWEKTGDYLFDGEGNLFDIVKFGPDWTGI